MNCARLRQVLDAWLDGEIDAGTGATIEKHLDGCPACAALKDERVVLSRQVRAQAPYYRAPGPLAASVRRSVEAGDAPARLRRGPSWLQAGAIAVVLATLSALAGFWLGSPMPESSLREHLVASHVASLGPSHRLTEVASSDRHTVKPWFQGKVDFAPTVRDLSGDGYVLLGGRLDHVAEGQAAAIVYRVRGHVINLFVWRAAGTADEPPSLSTARGFSLATWTDSGLRYAAVSDTDGPEIERFARLVSSSAADPARDKPSPR